MKYFLIFVTNGAIFMKRKTLFKYREYLDKEFRMKESELNAMMSVVADPIENVYKIESQEFLKFLKLKVTNTKCCRLKIWQH